jgi:hypothetical protein
MRASSPLSLFAACVLIAAGCTESSGPKVEPVATVSIVGNPATLQLGSTVTVSAQAKDAAGAVLTGRPFTWSSSSNATATVSPDGLITATGLGPVQITASAEGKSATVTINVIPIPVAQVSVTLSAPQINVGQTAQATATVFDGLGRPLTDRQISWSSSQGSVASVNSQGVVTGLTGGGPVSIIATVDGVTGSAPIFVIAPVTCTSTIQLAVGEQRLLSGTDRSAFCLGATGASEYALIPFNASTNASSSAPIRLTATNTVAPSSASLSPNLNQVTLAGGLRLVAERSIEREFRMRERTDLAPVLRNFQNKRRQGQRFKTSFITGMPAAPAVGSIFPINVSVTGNTCTSPKQLRDARVAAVTPKVIVLIDTQAPPGGYTDDELRGFAETFEQLGLPVDTLNFGSPTDIDGNGRFIILFTGTVNALSGTSGGIVGGLQASRDLFPVTDCQGSNEGEMFYMPVPDPTSVINSTYTNKASVAGRVQATLAHELQHLINAGRRIYINDANAFEEVWLNEGISHIAEELVYYQVSGKTRGMNINLPQVQASQAQLDAVNTYMVQNLGRLITYLRATEANSPYAPNDKLETRGATWQLLRYAADRAGGDERALWRALVNAQNAGQANFNAVFGSITSLSRDFAVTQYLDDQPIPATPAFTFASWNFRSMLPAINSGVYPLIVRSLVSAPLDLNLIGGGSSYVKFGVAAGATAAISASTNGQAPAPGVEFTVIRTQ